MGILFKSQELFRRLSTPRCLPVAARKSSKHSPRDAVQKLTDEVQLLTCPSSPESQTKTEELWKDVHNHLLVILNLLKELSENSKTDALHGRVKVTNDQLHVLEQFLAADLPVQLLSQLTSLEFEVRKDVMNVCCALLWPDLPEEVAAQVMEYVRFHPTLFSKLMDSYASDEAALFSGVVLRSFFRYGQLVETFLTSGKVFELIGYARHPSIDVAADAIYTLRTAMLEHKEVSGPWLVANYAEFFTLYNPLLQCEDYVVERQALTLLAGMLMDRSFQKVMMNYVSNEPHLKIIMNLLLADSKSIQSEAFHVFKIFVVNPQKPLRIQQILVKNKDRLVALLQTLQSGRSEDANFNTDQQKVIGRLLEMNLPIQETITRCKPLEEPTRVTGARHIPAQCQ
ncbi:unnamed protein product [Effrenium voratum]|uniref:Uncharacterized protein n=1 Tax=Effrenium voratum TaxID=2562239 RepID=A0AA36JDC8_9DINO|nr:unnamed protein product [Effrenium voratum]CAJ1452474.1 unnamed protein product [Effrenium voratum]|mmetsp:Transcript_112914/g.269040  ORF Transcript_112914/g.269040 Transcript_112914/m.269040 type:complete len:398 (+) Transcript_112914:226-1419(+)